VDLWTPKQPVDTPAALSVTQLLRRMKNLLEIQIGEVWVEGEVSNLRKQASGHWYFSLKDEGAQIACAMFGARKRPGADALQDGAKVRAFAEASVYEARGQLQIIVHKAEPAGAGDLLARFEALKRKLQAEGLFDPSRKKPLPRFPRTVGLITSGTGAALQDMLNVLGRRAPWVQPVLLPVRVQGKGAELEIAAAIERMGNPEAHGDPRCDVLIVGRGGGSIEDLWNFNEEIVARAIAACPIPVISAVGHEIDFTIADFVADLRAPTPSAAAELAVADGAELLERLGHMRRRIQRPLQERLQSARALVESLRRGPLQRDGERLLREPAMRVDSARTRLESTVRDMLTQQGHRLSMLRAVHRLHQPAQVLDRRTEHLRSLDLRLQRGAAAPLGQHAAQLARLRGLLRALGPDSAFQRGFSITFGTDGKAVRSARDLKPGDLLRTRFATGEALSQVTELRGSPTDETGGERPLLP
jgi:exodeoxyribonuclease VII large subunit